MELLEELKKQAFKGGKVPLSAQKDFAEIEAMLSNLDKTAGKFKTK